MQNDNDAKCQWYIYVNVAKCQCLQNDNIKNRKCSATIPTLMEGCVRLILYIPHITFKQMSEFTLQQLCSKEFFDFITNIQK